MHHICPQGVVQAAMGKHSLLLKPTRSDVTVTLWSWVKADTETLGGLFSSGLLWGLLQPHVFGHYKIRTEVLNLLVCLADSGWCCFFSKPGSCSLATGVRTLCSQFPAAAEQLSRGSWLLLRLVTADESGVALDPITCSLSLLVPVLIHS